MAKGISETAFITEKAFESQVKDLAKLFGYLYYHTWRSFHSPSGFPDCVLVRLEPEPRLIFIELKSETGQPTVDQCIWLQILQQLPRPVEAHLFRPSDFKTIAEVLR